LTFSISPEPSPDELAAIVAAVSAALHHRANVPTPEAASRTSRWARQGRLEAMRGLDTSRDER
jgi:hypothetical protein